MIYEQFSDAYISSLDKLMEHGLDAAEYLSEREKVAIAVLSGVPYKTVAGEEGEVIVTTQKIGIVVVSAVESVYGYKYRVLHKEG